MRGQVVACDVSARRVYADLVGRDSELQALRRVIAARPSFASVEGEAGVGKTRLVREALLGLDCTVLEAACLPQREPPPYFALIEALRPLGPRVEHTARRMPLLGALRPLFPDWSGWLPLRPESLDDPRAERHQLIRAIHELLGLAGPAVLLLEDVHWADDATLDVLRYLLSLPPPELALVVTVRPEDLPLDVAMSLLPVQQGRTGACERLRIRLLPLDTADVHELAEQLLRTHPLSRELADFLYAQTGGLPFAVEEFVQLMRERGQLVQLGGRWLRPPLDEVVVPRALGDAMRARLDGLSLLARRAVEAAAVAGLPVSEEELAQIARLDPAAADAGIAEALHAGLLRRVADRVTVRHQLMRSVAQDDLLPASRRRLHHRCAAVLALRRDAPAAILAEHHRGADDIESWLRLGEQAADQAIVVFDEQSACRTLLALLTETDAPADVQARLVLKLGEVSVTVMQHHSAAQQIRRVLDTHGDCLSPQERAVLSYLLAFQLFQLGEVTAALALSRTVVDTLGDAHPWAIRAMCWLALPFEASGPGDEQEMWVNRAGAGSAAAGDDRATLDYVVARTGFLLRHGRSEGWESLDEVRRRCTGRPALRRPLAVALVNAAEHATHLGQYERAATLAAELRTVISDVPGHQLTAVIAVHEAAINFATGRWQHLPAEVDTLIEQLAKSPRIQLRSRLIKCLIQQACGGRSGSELALELAEIFATACRMTDQPIPALAATALAREQLRRGDLVAARASAETAWEMLDRKRLSLWGGETLMVLTEILIADGDAATAERSVDPFAGTVAAEGEEAPLAAAYVLVLRALLERDDAKAGQQLLTAASAFESLPRPYAAWLARERAALRLLSVDEAHAVGILTDTATGLRRLGAHEDAKRLDAFLRGRGIAVKRRAGRRSYGDELSPREREVAGCLARGMSNAEIAASLTLSTTTVKTHVLACLRKLGVSRREELVGRKIQPLSE